MGQGLQDGKASLGDADSERVARGHWRAAKRSGIRGCCKRAVSRGDRPRSHKLLGGCDIKQLPRVEIGLSDDRQQVRTLATSLAATIASFAGGGVVLAATSGAAARALPAGLASGGSVGGQHVSFPEKVEVRCRRLSPALAQRGGSIEDQPFWAGSVVVSEVALALKLQCLAMGIRGGCTLDEATA